MRGFFLHAGSLFRENLGSSNFAHMYDEAQFPRSAGKHLKPLTIQIDPAAPFDPRIIRRFRKRIRGLRMISIHPYAVDNQKLLYTAR
jgi:hypothetical protein